MRAGAGGSGLLRSDGEGTKDDDGETRACAGPVERREDESGLDIGIVGELVGSSRNSTLMSFPWRELGGRGFFLPSVEGIVSSPRRSSSASDISWGVLGESRCWS